MTSERPTPPRHSADTPKVVVAIPAYNEERAIGGVVILAQRYADRVIVVDDGSTDLTAEIADRLGARVVRHPQNLGYGAAIRTCLEAGYKEGAEVVVTLDADGQHSPTIIPTLVKPILEGDSDLVIGSRFGSGVRKTIPKYREFGVKLITRGVSLATNSHLSDAQSGLRAYSRKALEALLPTLVSDGMGVSTEILMQAKERGLRVGEVPAEVSYDLGEPTSTKNPVSHGGEVVLSIVEQIAETRPLVYVGIPGLVCIGIGLYTLIIVLGIFNETRQLAIGTALLSIASTSIGLVLIVGATILYSMGRFRRRIESYIRNQRTGS